MKKKIKKESIFDKQSRHANDVAGKFYEELRGVFGNAPFSGKVVKHRNLRTVTTALIVEVTEGDGSDKMPYDIVKYVISLEGRLLGKITHSPEFIEIYE